MHYYDASIAQILRDEYSMKFTFRVGNTSSECIEISFVDEAELWLWYSHYKLSVGVCAQWYIMVVTCTENLRCNTISTDGLTFLQIKEWIPKTQHTLFSETIFCRSFCREQECFHSDAFFLHHSKYGMAYLPLISVF